MTREILKYPDPRLREVAKPVAAVTPEIQALVDDMAETMYESAGCGLAATQIGENHRIFVVDCAGEDEASDFRVFINPEILSTDGDQCASRVWEAAEICPSEMAGGVSPVPCTSGWAISQSESMV